MVWNTELTVLYCTLKLSLYCFLICIASDETSALILNFVPLYVIGLFYLGFLQDLLCMFESDQFVYDMSNSVGFGRRDIYPAWASLSLCDWWLDVFHYIWKIIHQSLQIFLLSHSLFHLIPFTHMLCHLILYYTSWMPCFCSFHSSIFTSWHLPLLCNDFIIVKLHNYKVISIVPSSGSWFFLRLC